MTRRSPPSGSTRPALQVFGAPAVAAVVVSGVLAAADAGAREDGRPLPASRWNAIPNCVDASSAIRFGSDDRRVLLDAVDGAAVSAAIVRRYPVLDRDAQLPDAIVLWKKAGAGWLFIALRHAPARPAESCFSATFVASRFELTAPLLVKYYGAGSVDE